ncbi:hypothetical protein DC915_RS02210 [Vibrio parahaemolyticus]|nr:hypothetical protein [Vibrio parahaemolyticus]EJG0009789.1 hypothetical protein [Vibrio parahaemolyticus]
MKLLNTTFQPEENRLYITVEAGRDVFRFAFTNGERIQAEKKTKNDSNAPEWISHKGTKSAWEYAESLLDFLATEQCESTDTVTAAKESITNIVIGEGYSVDHVTNGLAGEQSLLVTGNPLQCIAALYSALSVERSVTYQLANTKDLREEDVESIREFERQSVTSTVIEVKASLEV